MSYCYEHVREYDGETCPGCAIGQGLKSHRKVFDSMLFRYEMEAHDKWLEWSFKIPFIQFPSDWKIRITPPFGGAVARFRVWIPGMPDAENVSIYLDCFDRLGCYGKPYWEVHPYKGDCGRCDMADIPELLRMIAARG